MPALKAVSQTAARLIAMVRAYERWTHTIARSGPPVRYGVAVLSTALVTALMAFSGLAPEPATLSLIYLLAVLFAATIAGLGPGIVASVLSFLAYNIFFVEPRYILTVAHPQDVVRLVSFLVAAILASSIAGLVHRQAEQLGRRTAELESLYAVSQATSAAVDLEQILPALAQTTVDLLGVRSCLITATSKEPARAFAAPPGAPADGTSDAVLDMQLRIDDRAVGQMRVLPQPGQVFHGSDQRLLEMLASQATLAIERARLVGQVAEAHALAKSDQLKSVLLSSVSHDLRTPLASIKGIATALRQRDLPWESTAVLQMLDTLSDEADRLNRLVGNLLDMSRIESGALQPAREWEDLSDIVGGVLARMRPQLQGRAVHADLPADLPLVWVNAGLIDQVLTNLLENVLKYTPAPTPVALIANVHGDAVWMHIIDQGPGIAADALPHIFDKFFRVVGPEQHADGTGLGLAICKGIVEAHGGQIWAQNRAAGGAELVFTLPLRPAGAGQPPSVDGADWPLSRSIEGLSVAEST
jgi:two-component system sensor histidine kinase KdpD